MSALDDFLDEKISEGLGVKPEQVTIEFVHEMRKRMYNDPLFAHDTEDANDLGPAKREQWNQKCRKWAQEILSEGVALCSP